ncbi:hypothetical protein TNCV_869111 [Trichonephila clavipes]|nr:hypothetical protein TNCV_869111 [Trichonephila clavipes]
MLHHQGGFKLRSSITSELIFNWRLCSFPIPRYIWGPLLAPLLQQVPSLKRKGQYYRPPLSRKVAGFSKVQFQILVPPPRKTPGAHYAHSKIFKIQPGTTFGSPELASSVAGKGHFGRPALSSKVTIIPNIRFRTLIHHPENDHKSTFSTPKRLIKAPVMVCVIDSRPELSSKVATISHIGYQIQFGHLKIRQRPSFRTPKALN